MSLSMILKSNNALALNPYAIMPPNKVLHGVCLNPEDPGFVEKLSNYSQIAGAKPRVITFFAHIYSKGVFLDWKYYGNLLKRVDDAGCIPFVKATTADWYKPTTKTSWAAQDILSGKYDIYFIEAADAAKKFGKPMFLSWNHEMNGDWYPWSELFAGDRELKTDWNAEKYVQVWRYIVNLYRQRGASNVIFCWAPDGLGRDMRGTKLTESWKYYWPGKEYVDCIAPSVYNNVDLNTFEKIIQSYPNKPIFLSEYGIATEKTKYYPNSYPGDTAWLNKFFEIIKKYRNRIVGISYFQWEPDYYIQRNSRVLSLYRANIKTDMFINGH
jgi:hypothetical protein